MASGCGSPAGSFALGNLFDSFDALSARIKHFKEVNSVKLWKREARSIEAAGKRLTRYLKPELKYYELKLCCIHGGQKFKSKGKGFRNSM